MTTASTISASPAAMTRFFLPLSLQAASQGLTYPMAAIVAARGAGGPLDMAGFVQATTVMFLLGTLGFGLVTTGMVFGKTAEGFRVYHSVCRGLAIITVAVQAALCFPPAARLLFEGVMGVPPQIGEPARIALTACLPVQYLFFMRIPYQVVMLNALAATRASLATLVRIALTLLLVPLFFWMNCGGPIWAVVCLSVPVVVEVAMSRLLAAAHLQRLIESAGPVPRARDMVAFNLPLSIGGCLLSFSATVLAAFIARAHRPEIALPVYYLALGVVTPLAYGATRAQEVVLAFGAADGGPRRTLRFAMGAGAVLGVLPLVLIFPGIAEGYYVSLQNLPAGHLYLIRGTAFMLVAYPLCVAVRAQGEGLAGLVKRPLAVIAGQVMFMATVAGAGALMLVAGVPGHIMGPAGLMLGNLASTGTLRLAIRRVGGPQTPVAPTTTSHGQIR